MTPFLRLFKDHPDSVGETYIQHLFMASRFGLKMIGGGLACLVHGIFPFLFKSTGSEQIQSLHAAMVSHRRGENPERSSHKKSEAHARFAYAIYAEL